jgi:gliding motility-associated-like protein
MQTLYSKHYILLFLILSLIFSLNAQNSGASLNPDSIGTEGMHYCAGDEMMQSFLKNAEHQSQQKAIEEQIYRYLTNPATLRTRTTSAIVTLPVVVHIIHNGGAENINDAQVLKGIQDLNDAFANRGFYDPNTGVNTEIQFCLAQRDPNNLPTNGITRDVSPLTNMTMETDDIILKNINRWRTTCYINIWLIKEINSNSSGSGVAGYAYLPSAHGSTFDGIVEEARWFGSSPVNSTVTIHEMGHYLGLYHTFNGDCKNDNCLIDGDKICDTPPDQSRGPGCNPNANSCTTDADDPSVNNPFRPIALGGKGDVADMGENYMDYSPFSCYSIFTQGQKDRMNATIQTIRKSLLACKSCETPCPSPVTAKFAPRDQTIGVGSSLTFTNASTNATSYKWRVGTTNYVTTNITHPFNTIGTFKVVLEASNADARCQSAGDSVLIQVVCPVKVDITPLSSTVKPNTIINFTSTTQGATTYEWKVNGTVVGSNPNLNYTFATVGNFNIEFMASNGLCSLSRNAIVVVSNQSPCVSEYFAKTYAIGQTNVELSLIQNTSDGGIIATGRSNTHVLISKLDNKGQVTWARQFIKLNDDDVFKNVISTPDGGYIATGNFESLLGVYKFKADGNVEWIRNLDIQNCVGYGLVLTNDGGYAISGRTRGYIDACIIKLTATGTTQWAKLVKKSQSEYSYDLAKAGDGNLVMVCNSQGTYTPILKFNVATGASMWQKEYESGITDFNLNHSLDGVSTANDGNLIVTGGWDPDQAIFKKIDTNGNILWSKKINGVGQSVRALRATQQADGSYLVFLYNYASGNKHILLKLDANFNIVWQKSVTQGAALPTAKLFALLSNGDYFISKFENNASILIKTNALLEGCIPFEKVTLNVVNQNVAVNTISSFSFQDANPLYLVDNKGETVQLLATEKCSKPCDTTTQSSCNNPLFSRNYKVAEGSLSITDIKEDKNNTFIATGRVVIDPSNLYYSYLLKLDATGKVIWSKKVNSEGNGIFYRINPTIDGGYIAVGVFGITPVIVKFNALGSIEWANSSFASDNSIIVSVIQTKDGGYAVSGHVDRNDNTVVVKLKSDGTIQWTREIGSSTTDWSSGLEEMIDGNLLVASNTTSSTGTYLMKLDINNGNFIWQKIYSSGATTTCCDHSFDDVAKASDGNFLITGNWSPDVILFKKIDNNGNVLWAKKISQSGKALRGTQVFQTLDGGYIISAVDYNKQLERVIIRLDGSFKIQWQKTLGVGYEVSLKNVIALANGDYWIGANQTDGFSISKTDALANSCQSLSNSNAIIESINVQVSDGGFSNNAGREFFKITPTTTALEILTSNRCTECKEICGNRIDDDGDGLIDNADVMDCPCNKCFVNDSVKIVGLDTVCASPATFFTYRLKGYLCNKFKTNWLINRSGVDVIALNDTTLNVRFNQGTTFDLTAIIEDSCSRDTVTFKSYIIGPPPILELGPDKTVCQTGVFSFKAPKGFKSYLWQDFTTDSVFTAFGPGKYWVRVTDSCGGIQSDTVRITQLTLPVLNLTPDTLRMCEGDSIVATAPTGWATYRWSPSVGVNDTFKRVVTLTPSVSRRYFCAVSTLAGCVSTDSIWVDVKPLNNAIRSVSICTGQSYKIGDSTFTKAGIYTVRLKSNSGGCDTLVSLTLNTINNFTKQIDSLICTSQTIKVGDSTFTKAGNYTVILRGRLGGCDTIVTVNLKAPTVVEQTLNKTICQGQNLRVGDSIFTKSGTYKVFINKVLCKDTIITVNLRVTDLAVQTVAFNTCPNQQNGRITAAIKNGTPPYSYAWSNGETTANVNNLKASTYVLTVTDVNNCMNTANVTIKATPQYSYNLSVKQPTCYGDANGEIRISSTEKLSISFDSVVFNRSGFLNNLKAGNYPIFVKDSNNCIFTELINIPQPPQLILSLPADTLLRLGDSIKIESFTNGTGRLKYRWQPLRGLSCDTCSSVVARPTTGILYTLTLTDSTGCQVQDDIKILVNRVCNIFIPNVFSPFSTLGDNDAFYPFGSDCAKQVAFMEVFDRWGEMVFHKINFPLNDPLSGWDGTLNGKPLEAAVYAYRIEIILADGRLERFLGDITLIR